VTGKEKREVYYPLWTVFAQDQTVEFEGDEIKLGNKTIKVKHRESEHPARLLEGEDTAQIGQRVIKYVIGHGWNFEFEDIAGSSNGYTTQDGSKRVVVDIKLSPIMAVKTSLHEAAHMLLHTSEEGMKTLRDTAELEAESVAYIVGGLLGLDTTDYSIGYLTGWAEGDGEAVKATATRVLKTAHIIIEALDPSTPEAEEKE